MYALSAMGAASRLVNIESSSDLATWQPLTASATNRLYETIGGGPMFFRARQRP